MRVVLHFSPRRGAAGPLEETLRAESHRLRQEAPEGTEVLFLSRLPDDPFGPATRLQFTFDIRLPGDDFTAVLDSLDGLAGRLGNAIHPDLSAALVGKERVFIEPGEAPVRYQYLMRRNAEFTHDEYVDRYVKIHSQFGLKTPGIRGYVQFYVDPDLSKNAAARIGVGIWAVDSISELHLGSVEEFLAAVSKSPVGGEAIADEEKFLDRDNSYDFCSSVERTDGSTE